MKNKLTLQDVQWKELFIEDIFKIKRGNAKTISSKILDSGKVALITSKDRNNGYNFSILPEKTETIYRNCITVNNNGSVGYSYYHDYDFVSSSDVTIFDLKTKQNKFVQLFIVSILNELKNKYSYGYKMSNNRITRQKILLPIDENGNPNWQFMEEYIKQEQKKLQKKIVNYYQNKLDEILKNKDNYLRIRWKEFFIGGKDGIFDIKSTNSGIDKNKLNVEKGNIPYITRTDMDNGISLFISKNQNKKYKIDKGNVITIGLDTQTVFYQENDFYTGQNIQILRNDKLNKEISMFIIPLLEIQMKKFNWGGNGATLSRLHRTKIMLPVDDNEKPNYEFMENYIKFKKAEKYTKIIKSMIC